MYMLVYLFLSFVNRFVPASAYDTPLRRVEREISERHPFGVAPTENFLGLTYGVPISKWNAHPGEAFNDGRGYPGGSEFEKTRNTVSNLEITKSIELMFDPNSQMLTPVNESSNGNRTEDSYKSSLALLSPYTQKKLNKIFDKYGKEAKGGGITDVKNYQTGRFKLYYLKRSRFRA